jgi:uncharacterized protein YdeI (YjbR/CyaY-like superfamily)
MDIAPILYAVTRGEWRAWLNENHATACEIWLVAYSRGTNPLCRIWRR